MAESDVTTPALDAVLALADELRALADAAPRDRVVWVRGADRRIRETVGAVGDEAVHLMHQGGMTHARVGESIGVSPYRVNAALGRYRRWLRERTVVTS